MSVHRPDIDILARMIRVARVVVTDHHKAADYLPVLFDIESDIAAAAACPATSPRLIGSAELIVLTALMSLASEPQTAATVYRRTYTVQMFVEEIGEHFLAASRQARGRA